jgi:AcrR family transcriptional regulator
MRDAAGIIMEPAFFRSQAGVSMLTEDGIVVIEDDVQSVDAPETRIRDRNATSAVILAAARSLLAEQGFQKFGINAVARRAGYDKQLVYRYFGGLDGLLDAIADELADWVNERMPKSSNGRFLLTYADLVERMMHLLMDALRDDPLMLKIIAWEASDPSPIVRRMSEARSKSLTKWMDKMRGGMKAPAAIDVPALNAILIAAVQHMVLSAHICGAFGGVSLVSQKDWDRVKTAVTRLVQAAYS